MNDLIIAKEFLKSQKDRLIGEQMKDYKKINDAFKILWESSPSEEEFVQICDGLLITSRMAYIMSYKPWMHII